jgi:AcrR family transcriptional regulator
MESGNDLIAVNRRPTVSPELKEAKRRRALVLAGAALVHESGIQEVTVDRICRQAHVAPRTFHEHFQTVDDCLRSGVEAGSEELFAPIRKASERPDAWLLDVERAITGFYAAVAAEPILAELLLVHSFAIPRQGSSPDFDTGAAAMAELLAAGREQGPVQSQAPPLAEDYLARVIFSLAVLKLHAGEAETLPFHGREMAVLVGNAYLGAEQTARILRPAGADSQAPSPK